MKQKMQKLEEFKNANVPLEERKRRDNCIIDCTFSLFISLNLANQTFSEDILNLSVKDFIRIYSKYEIEFAHSPSMEMLYGEPTFTKEEEKEILKNIEIDNKHTKKHKG